LTSSGSVNGARLRRSAWVGVAAILVVAAALGASLFLVDDSPSREAVVPARPVVVRQRPMPAQPRRATPSEQVDVYAHNRRGMLAARAESARPLVYVPDSGSGSVDVIDPRTFRIVDHFDVGASPQHVTPSHDLRTLYVASDAGNTVTPIDPRTGRPGKPVPVTDPYNLYFTFDGRLAIVVAERMQRLDFRRAHSFRLVRSLRVPCAGVNHLDFTANGRFAIASCEFSGRLVKVDVERRRVVAVRRLPRRYSVPQDVRAAPNAQIFYVTDLAAGGVWLVQPRALRVVGFLHTGAGAHGLVVSRNGRSLYVANRNDGSVSVISFRTRRVIAKWRIPSGSPDMGNVSADGRVLWLSGRYSSEVYALSTTTGRLLARIPVGASPHGVCVWPQPGRFSLGHTGNMR
jgi:YVTN family beta-propeller protein